MVKDKKAVFRKLAVGLIAIGLGVVAFRAGMVAGAANQTPGSSGDPLITQSYLELRFSQLEKSQQSYYQKVSVTKGKSIQIAEGGEFIIYSGNATVLGDKGVINLTQGKLVKKGSKSDQYQHYISTSAESGVTATSSCIIYVKGNYTLK